jgi:thiol:disulfide interchange protein DsbD
MIRFPGLAASTLLAVALAATAWAQDEPRAKIADAVAEPMSVQAGGAFTVRVEVEVDPGFHVYGLAETGGLPPQFVAPSAGWPAGFKPGAPKESPAAEKEGDVLVHKGKVTFALPFAVAADVEPGLRTLDGALKLMVCDDKTCLTPRDFPFSVAVDVSTVRVARVEFVGKTAPAGGQATIEIELAIAKDWHVYGQKQENDGPPTFEWRLPDGWRASGPLVEVTPPHQAKLYGLDEPYWVHEGKVVLRQDFAVPPGAKPGAVEIAGAGSWQRCDDKGCSWDKNVPVAATAMVGGAAAAPIGGPPAAPIDGQAAPFVPAPAKDAAATADADPPAEQSLWRILASGIGWGLITILTPCVFPLLPVTVSFFSKQKGPALPRSTVYALGIVFTLTVIGLVFKSSLDLFARGTAFNLFVGVLFLALALSLFGMFELRLPGFLIDRAQEKSGAGGMIGPFFMAVVLALTSFSCSVPFLAIMFSQFDQGRVVASVLGLLAYSGTVALPFFLCSLFPSLLKSLPKSGGWLNAVKVTMGFVEFGLAFKFLRTVAINCGWDVLPRSLVLAIWTACAIGAALYLFGYVVLPHDTKVESIGVMRLLFAIVFVTLALYFVPGLFGRPLNAQLEGFIQSEAKDFSGATPWNGRNGDAAGTDGSPGQHVEMTWPRDDWDGALARAAEKSRPALFDFTGVG